MQLVVFIGIQASGKTSFFRERFSESHIHLNLDMLKTRRREDILFEACIQAEQPAVVDNTNHSRERRAAFIKRAKQAGFEVVGYFFQTRLNNALHRNSGRQSSSRVRASVLRATDRRLELPIPSEGFDHLYLVKIDEATRSFLVEAWDGTQTPIWS